MGQQPEGRAQLIEEISRDTLLRKAVVEVVLDSLAAVAMEKVANGEPFTIPHLCTITSRWTTVVVPESPLTGAPAQRLQRKKLRVTLSRTLRDVFKVQQVKFPDKPGMVDRKNWRDAVKWHREQRVGVVKPADSAKPAESSPKPSEGAPPSKSGGLPTGLPTGLPLTPPPGAHPEPPPQEPRETHEVFNPLLDEDD